LTAHLRRRVADFRRATTRVPDVPKVTAVLAVPHYLLLIEAMMLRTQGARPMTRTAKLFSLALAALMFAPMAFAALTQAAQMTA
jgi:hypothetical protein